MGSEAIEPFKLSIPEADLIDLRCRLSCTRWPREESVSSWEQGAPLAKVQDLCSYWETKYSWTSCEALLNSLPQFRTVIFGTTIYFLHVRSPEPDALPALLTHGWSGSVLEFRRVISPLIDPVSSGKSPADAFHLVIPALPGHGFSSSPAKTGWKILKKLAHPHITRYVDHAKWNNSLFVAMEYASYGNLQKYARNRALCDERSLRLVLLQLLRALKYLYDQGIVHRDI